MVRRWQQQLCGGVPAKSMASAGERYKHSSLISFLSTTYVLLRLSFLFSLFFFSLGWGFGRKKGKVSGFSGKMGRGKLGWFVGWVLRK